MVLVSDKPSNGTLAQLHHNQRGLPTQRYKVWTVLQLRLSRPRRYNTGGAVFQTDVSGSL